MPDVRSYQKCQLHQDGQMVSMSTSHAVGRGFAPWPCHTKDHHDKSPNYWHCVTLQVQVYVQSLVLCRKKLINE